MVGFLFYSELGQHVCFLFTTWAALAWAAWSAFYSELGQHGRLSILFRTWAAWSAFYSILNLGSMVGFLFDSELRQHGRLSI